MIWFTQVPTKFVGESLRRWLFEKVWYARRDLNAGPLAPEAGNGQQLTDIPFENKRLSGRRFGPGLGTDILDTRKANR
jgi:hypothetical protein